MKRIRAHFADLAGGALVFISAVGFSAKAVFAKLAYAQGASAVTVLFLRMLFSIPFLLLLARIGKKNSYAPSRKDWFKIIVSGIVGYYLASILDFEGLQYVSAGLERLILFTYPTIVLLFGYLFAGRKIRPIDVFALVLTYAGMGVVFVEEAGGLQKDVVIGGLLVFGCSIAYSVYLTLGGHMISKIGPERFTAFAMSLSAAAVGVHFALTSSPRDALQQPSLVYIHALLMAVLSTVLPAYLLSRGIEKIGAERASIIGTIGPVSTIFLAAIFLGEKIGLSQIAGTVLVLAGVTLVTGGKKRVEETEALPETVEKM